LVRVTLFAELVLPTEVVLKLRLVLESVTGAVPVPLRLTVCGLLIALSVKLSMPVAAPIAGGEKVTPTVQVPPAARLAPQVLLAMANGPVAAMPVNVSAVLSRLVTVTVFAALVLPAASDPKLRLEEESVTGALPLPVTATVWEPALSVIVRTPEAEPATVGENTTAIVQDDVGVKAALQVFVWMNGPVTVTFVTCKGPVPLLCTVIFRAPLEVPNNCEENDRLVGVTAACGVVPVPLSGMV
jgi:hypothetical protein